MNQYEFTLTFRLQNIEESPEKYAEELGAGGCNDALIGIGKLGSIALNFTRKAPSAMKAISTAIRDVKNVIPDVVLLEAAPDFVGMTDIAKVYGTSRQYIRTVITSQSRSFPAPIHEGNPSLWHLADVLGWIDIHEPERFDKTLLELANLNMQINSYKAFTKSLTSFDADVDVKIKKSRKEAEWVNLIREALGLYSVAVSSNPARKVDASPSSSSDKKTTR